MNKTMKHDNTTWNSKYETYMPTTTKCLLKTAEISTCHSPIAYGRHHFNYSTSFKRKDPSFYTVQENILGVLQRLPAGSPNGSQIDIPNPKLRCETLGLIRQLV